MVTEGRVPHDSLAERVDTHADTHVAAALDPVGGLVSGAHSSIEDHGAAPLSAKLS